MAKAYRSKVLDVVTGDEVGEGAKLFAGLREAKVNVEANCSWPEGGKAHHWIIVDDFATARKVARKAKFTHKTLPAVMVEMPNKVGALSLVLDKVAAASVSVDVAFATAATKKLVKMVMTTSADAKAIKAING